MTAVAGDFYEFLPVDERRAGFLVADVSGHGVPAALIASMIKVAVHSVAASAADPAELLVRLRGALHGHLRGQYVTAACLWLDTEALTARYSAAGHPPLALWRAAEDRLSRVESNGILFGVEVDSAYPTRELALAPGDRLVLYTDGLTEAENASGEPFGRLAAGAGPGRAPVAPGRGGVARAARRRARVGAAVGPAAGRHHAPGDRPDTLTRAPLTAARRRASMKGMRRTLRTLAAVLAGLALVAALPAPCGCAPERSASKHADEHACCAPPAGVSAADRTCCDESPAGRGRGALARRPRHGAGPGGRPSRRSAVRASRARASRRHPGLLASSHRPAHLIPPRAGEVSPRA